MSGWSAVGGMCEPAYIPTGYKIGDKPRGETVRELATLSLNRLEADPLPRPPQAHPRDPPLALRAALPLLLWGRKLRGL